MSESNEAYKDYMKAKRSASHARSMNYSDKSSYEKEERIKELEYESKKREEQDDFRRGYDLLTRNEY